MSFADWGTPETALAGLRWLTVVASLLLVRDTECSLDYVIADSEVVFPGMISPLPSQGEIFSNTTRR